MTRRGAKAAKTIKKGYNFHCAIHFSGKGGIEKVENRQMPCTEQFYAAALK
ncbi:hypothetical protein F6453_3900 [Marinobacter nauticus]|uniref:Uncharacterized protein n=1 Tax=Marinobacter nauticus TaxID=2743 RepID=A0A833JLF3_MARNT|nr:hypothetical protein F6453_3900 [Marinobacter nauticus]